MNEHLNEQSDPTKYFDAHQLAMIATLMAPLRRRIMDLEACLVYVRNFLPESLKEHAENVLFPKDAH